MTRRARADRLPPVLVGTVLEHPCPECGAQMALRTSRFGLFYGCKSFPACRATHGAHPNGRPLGVPGDRETKQARIDAHEIFDRYWEAGHATRGEAYAQLARALGVDEIHFGAMSKEECGRAIEATKRMQWDDPPDGDNEDAYQFDDDPAGDHL